MIPSPYSLAADHQDPEIREVWLQLVNLEVAEEKRQASLPAWKRRLERLIAPIQVREIQAKRMQLGELMRRKRLQSGASE